LRPPRQGLALAEEAYRAASDHSLSALAQQIEPMLASVRAKGCRAPEWKRSRARKKR